MAFLVGKGFCRHPKTEKVEVPQRLHLRLLLEILPEDAQFFHIERFTLIASIVLLLANLKKSGGLSWAIVGYRGLSTKSVEMHRTNCGAAYFALHNRCRTTGDSR